MTFNIFKNTVLLFVLITISCGSKTESKKSEAGELLTEKTSKSKDNLKQNDQDVAIVVGANQLEKYLPLLKGKKIAVVANQTSVIFKENGYTHLIDSLLSLQIDIKNVLVPEHGFRGNAANGEIIKDGIDLKTGLSIISLYGKNKKLSAEQLKGMELIVFDIQDVGARFYTYISTLHYVMEACAEQNIPVLILDRPNPNGHYIDGPVLEPEHKSFIGIHPIPVVHGLTIGEYAKMINGEKWLKDGVQCEIRVIPIKNYTHTTFYSLPIKPSPNLPNDLAINLYPSLCFFEGTNVSVGRGTDKQFQIFGSPFFPPGNFSFKPQPNVGSNYPKHDGVLCYGTDLTDTAYLDSLNLEWLISAYNTAKNKKEFFTDFFTKLAGTKKLRLQIEQGLDANEIRLTWKKGLEDYGLMRSKYVLYN